MLTDLPTTPAKVNDQIVFSIIVALVGTSFYAVAGGLAYLFIGLLVGNLYYLLKKRAKASKTHEKRAAA
ncbi:MAG TPA: hypothetical protein VJ546_10005 [Bacillales bacterium]|nr:hypothetical protein [Bacillales bacterium]